jgi:hypothetical protein
MVLGAQAPGRVGRRPVFAQDQDPRVGILIVRTSKRLSLRRSLHCHSPRRLRQWSFATGARDPGTLCTGSRSPFAQDQDPRVGILIVRTSKRRSLRRSLHCHSPRRLRRWSFATGARDPGTLCTGSRSPFAQDQDPRVGILIVRTSERRSLPELHSRLQSQSVLGLFGSFVDCSIRSFVTASWFCASGRRTTFPPSSRAATTRRSHTGSR